METRLYVGNLPYNVTEDELRKFFSQAGEITMVSLVLDRETRRPRGFGFVEMATQEQAEAAIQKFNNADLSGRKLIVSMARPREERGGGGEGGPRGRPGGRRGGPRGNYPRDDDKS